VNWGNATKGVPGQKEGEAGKHFKQWMDPSYQAKVKIS